MPKQRRISHSRVLKTLDRHPAMPALLRSMAPRAVATLFQRIGISETTELMTLVPAQTLLPALDESIWKSPRPGTRELIDVKELAEWLEAWHDIGETFLLGRLEAMSDEYLVLLLATALRVNSETQHPEYGDVFDAFGQIRTCCEHDDSPGRRLARNFEQ